MQPTESPLPAVVPLGDNPVLLWGMTAHERLRRIAAARKLPFGNAEPDSNGTSDGTGDTVILSNLAFVFDPAWIAWLQPRPGTVLTRGGDIVLAHVAAADRTACERAITGDAPIPPHLEQVAAERDEGIFNESLRKRERPFAEEIGRAHV